MALLYLSPRKGPLQQGELLGRVWEHRAILPPVEQPDGMSFEYESTRHDVMLVMSPDCDLHWDFGKRFPSTEQAQSYDPAVDIEGQSKHMPHVLLCDAHNEDQIMVAHDMSTKQLNNIRTNRDARYHHLPEAGIGGPLSGKMPELFLDFKKPLTLPTSLLYEGFRLYRVRRFGVVPPVYLQHLVQRFYGFLSRVALPD